MSKIDYAQILNEVPDGLIVLDSDENIVFVNERFKKIIRDENPVGKIKNYIEDIVFEGFDGDKLIKKYDIYLDDEKIALKTNTKKIDDGYVILVSLVKECICLESVHMDFVSTVSHELRTPLTSMKGFIDTMLRSGDKLDEAQKTRFLSIVQQQIGRLARLVEDLLTVSRLEGQRSKDVYRSVDIKAMCELILDSLKLKHQKHNFEVNVVENVSDVWVDYDKAQQILTNLIDNAAKYSYEETIVSIEISNKNDFVEISIKDEGVGIPEEYLSKLFNKFARIDNPLTREVQGTGLGLYITKTLIENMGGEISVESKEGKGSVFKVMLPVATAEIQAKQRFSGNVN